jgi:L-ascorbate metabolism protein UlaG (beta-lactamase superfamily)
VFVLLALTLTGCDTTFTRIALRNMGVAFRRPDPAPVRIVDPIRRDARLAVLWVGHATVLIQIDDRLILTDPVFTEFVGGLSHRLIEPGIAPEDLPNVDVVLVSHRHFDHLSSGTFALIEPKIRTVLTAEGVQQDIPSGAYVVKELRYGDSWERDGLRVTAVPVDHNGGRRLFDEASHPRAYTGFVIQYHDIQVYFPGDTAYRRDLFRDVASQFGRVDLALLPICPIQPVDRMLPSHLDPQEALQAADDLGARWMVPIHFGTFINSLDAPGACEAALHTAIQSRDGFKVRVAILRVGEQRVLIGRDHSSYAPVDADRHLSLRW